MPMSAATKKKISRALKKYHKCAKRHKCAKGRSATGENMRIKDIVAQEKKKKKRRKKR